MAYAITKRIQNKEYVVFESKSIRSIMNRIAEYGGENIQFISVSKVQKLVIYLFKNNNFDILQRIVESMNRNYWIEDLSKMWLINTTKNMEEFFCINTEYPNLERINNALVDIGLAEYKIISINRVRRLNYDN